MTQYTLLDPVTGDKHTVYEQDLTRNLQLNVILLLGDEPVGIITHRDVVSFCRWCAGRVLSRCQSVPPEAQAILKLVDKWLEDPNSVTSEELYQAANDAWDVVGAGDDTWGAVDAAVVAVADPADAASDAAWAVRSASRVADAVKIAGVSFEDQAQWLLEHLRSAQ